jgi:hypothetical protein
MSPTEGIFSEAAPRSKGRSSSFSYSAFLKRQAEDEHDDEDDVQEGVYKP